jgi:hypothetical protein
MLPAVAIRTLCSRSYQPTCAQAFGDLLPPSEGRASEVTLIFSPALTSSPLHSLACDVCRRGAIFVTACQQAARERMLKDQLGKGSGRRHKRRAGAHGKRPERGARPLASRPSVIPNRRAAARRKGGGAVTLQPANLQSRFSAFWMLRRDLVASVGKRDQVGQPRKARSVGGQPAAPIIRC